MTEPRITRHWTSLEERDDPSFEATQGEFGEELPEGPGRLISTLSLREQGGAPTDSQVPRRDFLKIAGFSAALAAATGCSRAPVQKALPLLVQPEELVPGRALYYASTCGACGSACGVLAKVRDGRPIKLEGNPQHALSKGGLCAVGQASLLGLYDSHRLRQPMINGKPASWEEADRAITAQLDAVRSAQGKLRFLSGTLASPSKRAVIADFLSTFPDAHHVIYDPLSNSAILEAHLQTHGVRALPHYRFDRADVIVSFDADFLGTWISPIEFNVGWRAGRDLTATPPRYSWHVQLEPRMSVTGSNADERFPVAPAEIGVLLTALAQRLSRRAGTTAIPTEPAFGSVGWTTLNAGGVDSAVSISPAFLDELANRLWAARGHSLVISGAQNVRKQVLVNYINHLLGNYGNTLDLERPSLQSQGNDAELAALVDELRQGKVRMLLVAGANPAYELPGVTDALKRVPLIISFAERMDEVAQLAHYICPPPHYLESWDDTEPVSGTFSITQPAIRPLFQTRALVETLAAWSGKPQSSYDILREHWRTQIFTRQKQERSFDKFWDTSVQTGYVEVSPEPLRLKPFNVAVVQPITSVDTPAAGQFALVLYPKITILDGSHAFNPWLQECPDPVSKVTWDNYACVSPATATQLGVQTGDVVRVDTPSGSLDLPAYVQPGQHDRVLAIALGYGSVLSQRFADIGPRWLEAQPTLGDNGLVGSNAAPLLRLTSDALLYTNTAQLSRTGRRHELACTQAHNTLIPPPKLAKLNGDPRPIVQETSLREWQKDQNSGVFDPEEKQDLWPEDHPYTGPRWGMVIDLGACTGCSGCVIACQAENNIPVVGRDEVRRNREMHWMRIDRYYSTHDDRIEVAHHPMLCQQCENAPCETVCPVLATVHTEEGLNAQVYNRCVGTRYCANNCPYKGRRFNWFTYNHNDAVQNLVLNPDVAVRSRGVMEKCSFCVQRIQAAKLEAKTEGRALKDGDIQTACQQSCPSRAITFGDLNDADSRVSKLMKNPRRYRVLAELNVKPAVGYLTLVRNRAADKGGEHNG